MVQQDSQGETCRLPTAGQVTHLLARCSKNLLYCTTRVKGKGQAETAAGSGVAVHAGRGGRKRGNEEMRGGVSGSAKRPVWRGKGGGGKRRQRSKLKTNLLNN